jgi:D-alanine-D-alanine ligase-like ATP-grasp enzyme
MESSSKTYCPDCGPVTVPHATEWISSAIDELLSYINRPFEMVIQALQPLVSSLKPGRLAKPFAHLLVALHMGTIIDAPDEKNNLRAKVIWEEATRRGIMMRELRIFGASRELFFASYEGDTIVFDGMPRPRNASTAALAWMDNKGTIMKKFRAVGIPVPRGRSCWSLQQAEQTFREINAPVIVKPHLGSRSRHTYIGITDIETLRHAFKKAKEISPFAVVQEQLKGFVFRVSFVNNHVAGVMRREPPHVIGDGKHTIKELIEQENNNPLRPGPIFHELLMNEETIATLAKDNRTLNTIPSTGLMVLLHDKVSRNYGASTTEIETIHPDNQALFSLIAKTINDPLVGVDFIIEDMAKSWREQKPCGVIECNSLPFIDLHHYPLRGPAKNVAGLVWDMIFPKSHTGQNKKQ